MNTVYYCSVVAFVDGAHVGMVMAGYWLYTVVTSAGMNFIPDGVWWIAEVHSSDPDGDPHGYCSWAGPI